MKKVLLAVSILSIMSIAGCSSPSKDTHQLTTAITKTLQYYGSWTLQESTTYQGNHYTAEVTYNSESQEYAMGGDDYASISIPQGDDLVKYYDLDIQYPDSNCFSTASASYIQTKSRIRDYEEIETLLIYLDKASEIYYLQKSDNLKNILFFIQEENYTSNLDMTFNKEDITSQMNISEKNGNYTFTYDIMASGKGDGFLGEVKLSYVATYDNKITGLSKIITTTHKKEGANPIVVTSRTDAKIDYNFDAAYYNKYKTIADSVSEDQGYIYNKFNAYLNGVYFTGDHEEFYPNQHVTKDELLEIINEYAFLTDVEVEGVYVDKECTIPFIEGRVNSYNNDFYLKATPKEGKTILYVRDHADLTKGYLPLDNIEFNLYLNLFSNKVSKANNTEFILIVNNNEDYQTPVKNKESWVLQSMIFDDVVFDNNYISEALLSNNNEHTLMLNYIRGYKQDYTLSRPGSVDLRLIKNDMDGIVISGINNYSYNGLNIKMSTNDFIKENPTYQIKVVRSDILLSRGDSLPDEIVTIDPSWYHYSYIIGEDSFDTLPTDYTGEFILSFYWDAGYTLFNYIIIE